MPPSVQHRPDLFEQRFVERVGPQRMGRAFRKGHDRCETVQYLVTEDFDQLLAGACLGGVFLALDVDERGDGLKFALSTADQHGACARLCKRKRTRATETASGAGDNGHKAVQAHGRRLEVFLAGGAHQSDLRASEASARRLTSKEASTVMRANDILSPENRRKVGTMPRHYSEGKLNMDILRETAKKCKNWGRWGPDDEAGTLNFITPEDVIAAANAKRAGGSTPASPEVITRSPGRTWSACSAT